MEIDELPQLVSLTKVSRRLGIAPRWVRDALLKSNKVQLYRLSCTSGHELMFDIDDLDTVRDCILVRVNDPEHPLPPIDPSAMPQL